MNIEIMSEMAATLRDTYGIEETIEFLTEFYNKTFDAQDILDALEG